MCSNDRTFAPALTQAYRDRGFDVVAGVDAFETDPASFDLIHFHWPEELVGWGANVRDPDRTAALLAKLDRLRGSTVLVATIHNLIPHNTEALDGPEAAYFAAFYERMDLIGHYSAYSRERYAQVYPSLDPDKQIVQPLNSYAHLKPLAGGRAAARQALGLADAPGPVFALCGALRTIDELELVQSAWRGFNRQDARLLLATQPSWKGVGSVRAFIGRVVNRVWRNGPRIVRLPDRPDDATLVQIMEAVDALLIPRLGYHLNSGLIPLALTFGTGVIAPDSGPNREIVPLPTNELYTPGDAPDFARAMERQAAKSESAVRAANLAYLAEHMGWDRILDLLWPHVVAAGRAKGLAAFG